MGAPRGCSGGCSSCAIAGASGSAGLSGERRARRAWSRREMEVGAGAAPQTPPWEPRGERRGFGMPRALGGCWGALCEVMCPAARRGRVGWGCTGWGIHPGALGVPRPAHGRASGSRGGRSRPFPAAASPSLQPVSCLRLLLFWVRGQGRAGPAAGNSRARARAIPGTSEPPRARLCHRVPCADVPNTPGTAPSRPTPRAAPGHPGAGRGVTGSGMVPTEPSGRAGGAGQDLATLPRSGRHRRPIRPGIRPRDLPAGRGRNRPSSCSASGFPCSCVGLLTGPCSPPGIPHPVRSSAPHSTALHPQVDSVTPP